MPAVSPHPAQAAAADPAALRLACDMAWYGMAPGESFAGLRAAEAALAKAEYDRTPLSQRLAWEAEAERDAAARRIAALANAERLLAGHLSAFDREHYATLASRLRAAAPLAMVA